jgi:alanine racemase
MIDGRTVPVVGRVSMDLITLDVSSLAEERVRPGCDVVLIGPGLDADALGDAAGTIGYEILTRLGQRYRRIYLPAAA